MSDSYSDYSVYPKLGKMYKESIKKQVGQAETGRLYKPLSIRLYA